jgi:hypothetical protein
MTVEKGVTMTVLRNTADDAARHEELIETLARESDQPVEYVRELFEAEHKRLISAARVKTFVSVIATRLVKNTLSAERAQP